MNKSLVSCFLTHSVHRAVINLLEYDINRHQVALAVDKIITETNSDIKLKLSNVAVQYRKQTSYSARGIYTILILHVLHGSELIHAITISQRASMNYYDHRVTQREMCGLCVCVCSFASF